MRTPEEEPPQDYWDEMTDDEPRYYTEDAGPECLMVEEEFKHYYEFPR